jgi:O-antigen/teichoic acid export membrane protein
MLRFELKRLASGSLIYGIGGILQRFIGLLLLPFFTRVLSPQDYGVVALIGLASIAFSGLFNLGTGNSMGILYFREEDKSKRPIIIWSNALLLFINSLLLTVALLFAAPWISDQLFQTPAYSNLIRLSFCGLAFTVIADPFLAYLRMEEKAKRYMVLTLLSTGLSITLSVWLVLGLKLGVLGMVLSGVITQGLMLLIVLWTIARQLPFRFDLKLFKPLARIGFPSIFGLFAFLLIDYADRQMLQRMVGLGELGVYSVGYSFGMVMMIFVGAFGTAWPPFFMSFVNRREDAKHVFGRVLKYYLLGFGVLVMLFFAVAKPIVVLMLGPAFQDAFVVVGMVAAAYMLKGCYLILLPGIYFEQKLYIQTGIEWVAALVNIGLNFLWIPMFGLAGAAGATLVSYLCLPVLSWFFAKRYLAVDYDWSKISVSVASLTIACTCLYQISKFNALGSILLYGILVLLATLVLIYRVIMQEGEREFLSQKIKGLIFV